jgi:serine/threonine-protein kinase
LRHPNVVEVRDVDETLGMMVMEYLPGGTLADRFLPRRGLLPAEARRVALEVLSALEAAHQHGVVHRDLKPANILFDAAGTAKLGDFGVAHLVDAGQTQTAGLIGTLAYMSPEQVTGAPITFAADLYALGVTLHEMLTGALPFPGPDFVAQHIGDAPPPTGLGKAWDAVVHRLLEKAPEARFGSIDEARAALTAIAPSAVANAPGTPPPATAVVATPAERYIDRREIGATAWSRLFEATDARLGRVVVLEEFAAPLEAHLPMLRALARAGGPHFQRLLRIDNRTVVYEAIAGSALAPPLAAAAQATVMRALAPLHAEGHGHGALRGAIALCAGEPVVRIAGLCDPARPALPADDLSVLSPAPP